MFFLVSFICFPPFVWRCTTKIYRCENFFVVKIDRFLFVNQILSASYNLFVVTAWNKQILRTSLSLSIDKFLFVDLHSRKLQRQTSGQKYNKKQKKKTCNKEKQKRLKLQPLWARVHASSLAPCWQHHCRHVHVPAAADFFHFWFRFRRSRVARLGGFFCLANVWHRRGMRLVGAGLNDWGGFGGS